MSSQNAKEGFGYERTYTVADTAESMPFGGGESEPVGEALEPSSLSRCDHSRFGVMYWP